MNRKENEGTLTYRQAFNCMVHFLEAYYERGLCQSEDLANLLSNLQFFPDGSTTVDPAQWKDWIDSIEKKDVTMYLRLTKHESHGELQSEAKPPILKKDEET